MKAKKLWIGLGITAAVLAGIYIGISIYFMGHFFYGAQLNQKDVSGMSIENVEQILAEEVAGYQLSVKGKENMDDVITGEEIGIKYSPDGEIKKVLKKQKSFLWPLQFAGKTSYDAEVSVVYDEAKLKAKTEQLSAVTNPQPTDSISAKPVFDGEKFVPEAEVYGTKLDRAVLDKELAGAVKHLKRELNLEEAQCYQKPKFLKDAPEVQAACDTMNNYCKASITYDMAPQTEVVDAKVISGWLTCDGDMKVVFQEEKVREYMAQFGQKYDTLNSTRPLTTPWGKAAEVPGGTYGWVIDEAAEAEALLNSIRNGETVTKEPAYIQRGATHEAQDWGRTFIEVDLSGQHMWYIVDGNVAFEADVVTGKPYEHSTPAGVFEILMMQSPSTLVGNIQPETGKPEYRTKVDFWMQATWGGVGFHDATWQPYFGGSLYLTNGSHGCINMSWNDASVLYSMITVGTPVVMHY